MSKKSKNWMGIAVSISTIISAVAVVMTLWRTWNVPDKVSRIERTQTTTIQQIVNVMEGTIIPKIDTLVLGRRDTIFLQRSDTIMIVKEKHDTLYLPVPARKIENGQFKYVSPEEEREIDSREAAFRAQMDKKFGNR